MLSRKEIVMKKNSLKSFIWLGLLVIGLSSCGVEPVVGPQGPQGEPGKDGVSIVSVALTNSSENIDTYTITYSDGHTSTFEITNGQDGKPGENGQSGQNGLTPFIGENGNWWIGEQDTGIYAQGEQGNPGQDGKPGADGLTPYIGENGNWWIGKEDTGIHAQGKQGNPGADGLTPYIGENGNWWIGSQDTGVHAQGEQGRDGSSVLTANGVPEDSLGKNGDSYINLDNWDYYVKENDSWNLRGNIKGNEGQAAVSITSTIIDEKGDLIITFSNGDSVNAGHVKDVNEYTVKFFCDDLLVDTQIVKHGEKVISPILEDFVVKHWYIDRDYEFEWQCYGNVVTEDMSLYGKYTPITKEVSFDKSANISIDEYGYGDALTLDKEICVSKAVETVDYLTSLESRGILFNKSEIGVIGKIIVDIDSEGFESAKMFYGNNPFSINDNYDLVSGLNEINVAGTEYFTIQNTGSQEMNVNSIKIEYSKKTIIINNSLPTVIINTKNQQPVTSRTEYVTCEVSTEGADKDVSALKGKIKVRGNSTAGCPKKPYRIKFDKKNSLFGYEKAKNWSLLAEYMDGSNMHNYTALKFAKIVRGDESFGANPLHVNVIMNCENIGLYTFCEHIDAKEGRLNIEQENIWEKEFDDINFYIERDSSTVQDPLEIEGETYFKVQMENYPISEYVFAIKYPEKEDFEEELDNGSIDTHEEEFYKFFDNLKEYMTEICNKFVNYYNDYSCFDSVNESVDMQSLAEYAVTDQVFDETDHGQKSFKMYRFDSGLLKFGPNWDYDSCSYGLPYTGMYILNPFELSSIASSFKSTWFGEKWGYRLYSDLTNGRQLFQNVWNRISNEMIDSFLENQYTEMNSIASISSYDCGLWMNGQYFGLFDNIQYYWKFVSTQLPYLKSIY